MNGKIKVIFPHSILRLLFTCVIVLATSCSSMNVLRDYDVEYDFSKLKTYVWKGEKVPENALIDERIHTIVDLELAGKGYQKVEKKEDADFMIAYLYLVQDVPPEEKFRSSVGLGMGTRGGFGGIGLGYGGLRKYDNEVLALDVIDNKSGELIWRGHVRENLLNSKPEKTTKNFKKAIEEILKKFPPDTKK